MSSEESTFAWSEAEKDLMWGIDTTVPNSARICHYWWGGRDCYPVDREAGDEFAAAYPSIVDMARQSRYFLSRVVRYLAGEAGVGQFLDIGVGMPAGDNTHEIAQWLIPEARVVYVDNDALVGAFARALLTSSPPGCSTFVDADLHEVEAILAAAGTVLDFSRPVAILLGGVMRHIAVSDPSDLAARSISLRLGDALPPDGYLAIWDATGTDPAHVNAVKLYNKTGAAPWQLRSTDQITRLFDGLDLVDPGVVPIPQWRPDPDPCGTPAVDAWGGLARKPTPSSTGRGIDPSLTRQPWPCHRAPHEDVVDAPP